MDSGVVSGLLAALEAAYASHTPDRVRVEANQFLDAFKKNNPPLVVLNASMELLKRGVTTEVRYYGLHAFEYVVLKNWNTVTLEDRALIKQNILELMASPLSDISTSSTSTLKIDILFLIILWYSFPYLFFFIRIRSRIRIRILIILNIFLFTLFAFRPRLENHCREAGCRCE